MPNVDRILVGPELGESGNNVRNRSAAVAGELAQLKSRLTPIFEISASSEWQGLGQESYAPYQEAWNKAALGLFGDGDSGTGVLGQIASLLDQCYINYCNNEHAIVRGWTPGR